MKITSSKVGSEARNPARKTAAKNPAAKKPTTKRSKAQNLAIALEMERQGHPRKAKEFFRAAGAAKNPAKLYAVHKVGMRSPIAVFSARSDALEFGQRWADVHKTPVQVTEQ